MNNTYHGQVRQMWGVDQTKIVGGTIYFSFTKIGTSIQNAPEEIWFLSSKNLLSEKDPAKIQWQLLPEGDHGILPPGILLVVVEWALMFCVH